MEATTTTTAAATTATAVHNSNSYHSWRNIFLLALLLGNVLLLSLLILNSSNTSLHPIQLPQNSPPPNTTDELEVELRSASMGENKTVIIAVVNKAYVEGDVTPNMLDLFLEAFWRGEGTRELINHLVIISVDQISYERCRFHGLHCYRLDTDDQDLRGEAVFMSKDFLNMMWRRTLFLMQVLKKGYSFIFTDTDMLWLRNPLPLLTSNSINSDIQFSTDSFNGDTSSFRNKINTGFYFVKSNNKTISMYERWYGLKAQYPRHKEQDVLQKMAWQGMLHELGLKVRFLENWTFSGFCQRTSNVRIVITVHANCCRFISAKVADLREVLHEWVQFRAAPPNGTKPVQWSKHKECANSWHKKVSN